MPAPEATFEFCGEGLGVPGLPHTITEAEAQALGLAELLQAAVAAHNYRRVMRPEEQETDDA